MTDGDDAELNRKATYRTVADTWHRANYTCPNCGSNVMTNGKMYDCTECEWWEPL